MPEQQGLTDGAIQWLRKLLENEGYYVGVGSREEWTAVWIGDDDWDQFCEPDWGNIQSVNAEPRVRLRAEQIPFVKTLLATIDRLTESPGSDGAFTFKSRVYLSAFGDVPVFKDEQGLPDDFPVGPVRVTIEPLEQRGDDHE